MIPIKNTAKDLWQPKRRIEVTYKRSLRQIVKKMNKELKGLSSTSEIIKVLRKFADTPEFKKYAEKTAMKMITSIFTDAGKTWREAVKRNSRGRVIYKALKNELNGPLGIAVKEQVWKNAELIKSIPLEVAKDVTEYAAKKAYDGMRASDIAQDLLKDIPTISEKKANLIARTEVSKASTELTRARSENLGIRWYIWRTSEDQRVRSSHDHMDGVIICWDNPPSPEKLIKVKSSLGYYHAGECPNCRCYPEPIVKLDFITWPAKVYYQGKIQRMSKKQFEMIA
ncbi:phage head morphogenesis protein [Clostridium butyricum]|uniref:phage head morphogenesis protein n=1 Tax=Clostridium butyricum TaxID=1492 RepID=UPI002AB0A2D9|nr:phage minor head protein [Clostridium butyricum]